MYKYIIAKIEGLKFLEVVFLTHSLYVHIKIIKRNKNKFLKILIKNPPTKSKSRGSSVIYVSDSKHYHQRVIKGQIGHPRFFLILKR